MANANVNLITTANTFQDWMIRDNNTANIANEAKLGNLYKDNGSIVLANGSITLLGGAATLLSVSGNVTVSQLITSNTIVNTGDITVQGNNAIFTNITGLVQAANGIQAKFLTSNNLATFQNVNTAGYILWTGTNLAGAPTIAYFNEKAVLNVNNKVLVSNTGNVRIEGTILLPGANGIVANGSIVAANAFFGNLQVSGLSVVSNTVSSTDTSILRYGLTSIGDGHIIVVEGSAGHGNAELKYNSTSLVWQTTANNLQAFSTILTTANIVDNYLSTSITNVPSANALNAAFSNAITLAVGNATSIYANSGAFVAQRQGLNLIAGAGILLNVSANGANANLVDATINSAPSGIFANNGSFVAQRPGLNIIAGANMTINVAANGSNSSIVDATFVGATSATVPVADSVTNTSVTAAASANSIVWLKGLSVQKSGDTMSGNLAMQNNQVQLAVLKAPREVYSNVGTVTTTTVNLDCSKGSYLDITLAGNPTIVFQNVASSGNTSTFTVFLRQTSNGSNTVTWSNTIRWSDNVIPVLSTTANTQDNFTFFTYNGGVSYQGAMVMANIASANIY